MKSPHSLDAARLLEEESRIRFLAQHLVLDETQVDDVTQEVVVAALRQQPRARGPQLRAWLATVTRRTATRLRRKEDSVRQLERAAARPECSEDTSRVLELHRQLHVELDTLPAKYRDALVLRYLREHSFKELATQLGIPEPSVRKRVSRALALLRERLDQQPGGRQAWLSAFGALAFGDAWKSPVVTATSTSTVVLGLLSMKKLVAVGLAGALLLLTLQMLRPPAWLETESEEGGEFQVAELAGTEARQGPVAESGPALGKERRVALALPLEPRTELLVVDERRQLVPRARAAWIDAAGKVRSLEPDGDGTFALPSHIVGRRLYAIADGFAGSYVEVDSDESSVTIKLRDLTTLHGRIEVEGGSPSETIAIRLTSFNDHRSLEAEYPLKDAQSSHLDRLGFAEPDRHARTDLGGRFVIDGVFPESRGLLELPHSYRILPKVEDMRARYKADGDEVVVRVERVPYLFGHVVWADTGAPVVGGLDASLKRGGTGTGMTWGSRSDLDGRFEVGIAYIDRERPELGLEFNQVGLEFYPQEAKPLAHLFEFEISSDQLPLDLGTLRLDRSGSRDVRLLDHVGVPIEGGFVLSSLARVRSAPDGTARIAIGEEQRIRAIAPGFFPLEPSVALLNPSGETDLRLVPSPRFSITTPSEDWPLTPRSRRRLGITYDVGLFAGLPEKAGLLDPHTHRLSQLLHEDRVLFAKSNADSSLRTIYFSLSEQPLVLSGLRPGAELSVALFNDLEQPIASQRFATSTETGLHEIVLIPDPAQLGSVRFEVVEMNGRAISDANLFLEDLSEDGRSPRKTAHSTGLIRTGNYRLSARSPRHLAFEYELIVVPGEQVERIVLAPARQITVECTSPRGYDVQPSWLYLSSASGWSSCFGRGLNDGKAIIESVPFEQIDMVARFGTVEVETSIPVASSSVVLASPEMGSLRARVLKLEGRVEDWGELELFADSLEGSPSHARADRNSYEHNACGSLGPPSGHARYRTSTHRDAKGSLDVEGQLPPGRYAVEVAFLDGRSEDGTRRTLYTTEVRIEAGAETLIEVPGEVR